MSYVDADSGTIDFGDGWYSWSREIWREGSWIQEMEEDNSVPRRDDLLLSLERANQGAWWWIVAQLVLLGMVGYCIDWNRVANEPLVSTVAIAMMIGPTVMSILYLYAQNKKEIDSLKESTRFGEFDKHRLRMLQRDTVQRLKLPDIRLPVYITADKSLNAGSLRLGLGAFFASMNGIYLNRQVLHRLNAEEVQSVMGHELGHFYCHYVVSDRFRALTIALGAMIGLLVSQWTGMSNYVSVVISFACASAFWTVAGRLTASHGKSIEYLCDDLGAQIHGVNVAINGLLKVGLDSETQVQIQHQAVASTRNGSLSVRGVVEAVEKAMPYGNASREELELAVERSLKEHASKARTITVGGFLNYMWNSESEADLDEQWEEQAALYRAVQEVPRLPWERLLRNSQEVYFSMSDLPELMELIEKHPEGVLFHLPSEIGITDDVHPSFRNRILYLWHNRREIAIGSTI